MKKLLVIFSILFCCLVSGNVNASSSNILDNGGLYTTSEKENLGKVISKIEKNYDITVHINVYEDEIKSQNHAISIAEDFVLDVYNTYNVEVIVIVLGVNNGGFTGDNFLEINYFGRVDRYLSNGDANDLFYDFGDDFYSSREFYTPMLSLLNSIESILFMGQIIPHIVILVIVIIITVIVVVVLVVSRGSVSTVSHHTYSNNNEKLVGYYDRYVRTTTVRTPVSSSSGSGGSSRSGGGRSGGGGGRF